VATIQSVEILQVDLAPKVVRTDAIQSFVTQETPIVRIRCDDGATGVGYSYTIGTGGSSVVALLRDHLAPKLIGRDPDCIEAIWKDLFFHTHATAVGAITSLSLAAIDTALWDLRCRRSGLPLWKAAGGAQPKVPVYTTEGGWLHLPTESLVAQTLEAKAQGFRGAKLKVASRISPKTLRGSRRCAKRWAGNSRSWSMRISASTCPKPSGARGHSNRSGLPVARGAAAGRGSCRPRRARSAHVHPHRGG
jgi:L-alanine-DL-glutamate epimerase-like enolase superfamily enzyme